jgi:hypothetical protein
MTLSLTSRTLYRLSTSHVASDRGLGVHTRVITSPAANDNGSDVTDKTVPQLSRQVMQRLRLAFNEQTRASAPTALVAYVPPARPRVRVLRPLPYTLTHLPTNDDGEALGQSSVE